MTAGGRVGAAAAVLVALLAGVGIGFVLDEVGDSGKVERIHAGMADVITYVEGCA